MNLTITVGCNECEKQIEDFNIDYYDFICEECENKKGNLEQFAKDLIDKINKSRIREIEGDYIVGFKTEEEKYSFLRGVNYGMKKAIWQITQIEYDGLESLSSKYEEMEKVWKDQKVNPKLVGPDIGENWG